MREALRSNLAFLKMRGVHGLLALGSTGEFLQLDLKQRREAMEEVAVAAAPLRLMFNVSDIRPATVIDLARFSRQLGAHAISLLPPYFYPVAQEDLVEFFLRAAEAAELPLFLYNFPERTGNRIGLETIAAVAERVPVAGVKQSGSEFSYHNSLVQLGREKGFIVLTGSDTNLGAAIPLGVKGCVSGLSNAVPELVAQALVEAGDQRPGRPATALERLAEIGRRIQEVAFPLNVGAVMQARHLPVGVPKSVVSPHTQERIETLATELRQLFHEWNLA